MATALRALIPRTRNSVAFSTAAASYLEHGGERRYLDRIVAYFADTPADAITPFDVKQMALALYPEAGNSTRNRQALTPCRAVLIHAYERGWCPLMRLTRFKQEAPIRKTPASPAWLQLFIRQCDRDGLPHVAAIVLFMATTGARVSEAIRLRWPEVDLNARRAVLLRTKTSTNSVRDLNDAVIARLRHLALAREDRVFTYICRHSVNERIAAVCRRAGISYKSAHLCGRHSFATNVMALDMDIKTAMEAGDWKSSEIFIETYVHVRNASRRVADAFNSVDFSSEL